MVKAYLYGMHKPKVPKIIPQIQHRQVRITTANKQGKVAKVVAL